MLAKQYFCGRHFRRLESNQQPGYFFLPFCAKALPAADLEALLVLPSRSVFEAADAAFADVCLLGALCCDNALPAAFFEVEPVDVPLSVFEALLAAFLPVTFLFMSPFSVSIVEKLRIFANVNHWHSTANL